MRLGVGGLTFSPLPVDPSTPKAPQCAERARRSWTEVDQARPKVGGSRPNVKRSWPEWTWPGSHAVIVALPRRADQQRVGGNAPHINNKKIGWG